MRKNSRRSKGMSNIHLYIVLSLIAIASILPFASAEIIEYSPAFLCGETIASEFEGLLTLENKCLSIAMESDFTPVMLQTDKFNGEEFKLNLMGFEERKLSGPQKKQHPLTTFNLTGYTQGDSIVFNSPDGNVIVTYTIIDNKLKVGAELTDFNYQWPDSELWSETLIHKGEGSSIYSETVFIDGIPQEILEETKTVGQNTFLYQKLGRGDYIVLDPVFEVETDPFTVKYLQESSGQVGTVDDTDFEFINDVTVDMTDDNDLSRVTLSPGNNGDALKSFYNITNTTFDPSLEYFLEFRQPVNLKRDYNVRGYVDNVSVALDVNTLNVDGLGWFAINVTDFLYDQLFVYNLTYPSFRLFSSPTGEVSELKLIGVKNDTQPPNITACYTSTSSFTCGETVQFICNVTDDSLVASVHYNISDIGEVNTSKFNDLYIYEFTRSDFDNLTYTWIDAHAIDVFDQESNYTVNQTVSYVCAVPTCLEYGKCIDEVRLCELANVNDTTGLEIECTSINTCDSTTWAIWIAIALVLIAIGVFSRLPFIALLGSLVGLVAGIGYLNCFFWLGILILFVMLALAFFFAVAMLFFRGIG